MRGHKVRLVDLNAEFFWYLWNNWANIDGLVQARIEQEGADPQASETFARYCLYHLRITLPLLRQLRLSSKRAALAVPDGGPRVMKLVHRSVAQLLNICLLGSTGHTIDQLRTTLPELARRLSVNSTASALLQRFFDGLTLDDVDAFGLSLLSESQLPYALMIAKFVRKAKPKAITIAGGAYVTEVIGGLTDNALIFDYFDYLVVHEGESALLNILADPETAASHPNVITAGTSKPEHRSFHVEDIDALPAQDFSQFNLELYRPWGLSLPLYSSKGCTWGRCAFCSVNFLRYRERDAATFYEDAVRIARSTGVSQLQLVDEDVHPERLRQFAELALGYPTERLEWMIQTRFYPKLDRELLTAAAAGGFRTIEFGLESTDKKTLKRIRKGISLAHVERIVRDCADLGIRVILNFMIGFPWEDETHGQQALAFVEDLLHRHPTLDLTCNTQAVKLYVNSDFHRDPDRYDIRSSQRLALSPITDWKGPDWVNEFTHRHSSHPLLNGRSLQIRTDAVADAGAGENLLRDPTFRLRPYWHFIPDPQSPRTPSELAGSLLIEIGDGSCSAMKVNEIVAEAAPHLVAGSSLELLKQQFVGRFSEAGESEALRALADALLTLNRLGALSVHAE